MWEHLRNFVRPNEAKIMKKKFVDLSPLVAKLYSYRLCGVKISEIGEIRNLTLRHL
jgi:hypothetical protein